MKDIFKEFGNSGILICNVDGNEFIIKGSLEVDESKNKHKNKDIILPEIIHERKNDVYVAKFPDGTKEVNILKPNRGDAYDLEKGLLYYVIKKNLDLGKVIEWMNPILDESKRPENIEKKDKEIAGKINKWFEQKSDEPINDKECQKIINGMEFFIENQDYVIEVCINNSGIVEIYDKKNDESIDMIKDGFPQKGYLRHLIYNLYNEGHPSLEYYKLKKLTYKFYKGCFDSVESSWRKW